MVRYPGLPPRRQLTYQAKQTISREMEQEKMRRAEQLMLQRNPVAVRRPLRSIFRLWRPESCPVCHQLCPESLCVIETGREKNKCWTPTHQEPSAEAGEHCQADHSGDTGETPAVAVRERSCNIFLSSLLRRKANVQVTDTSFSLCK